ncbi:MAG TPA: DUF4251 domain-containing protein [Parafilimonas sp.]|jgi:hypothetical protein
MKSLLMIICFAGLITQTQAQDSTKQSIKSLVDSKHFTFEPITMTPSRGGLKQLTLGYFFKINGDTLKMYLPYIGRAYSAPINPSDAGFDFTTTHFTYASTAGKRNSTIVNIKTKDKVYNSEFSLTIYDNGSAYLRANASDKEPVSYNGEIKENK